MKKNIGLCVCHDTKNFGSQLQVLATQEIINKLGYDYEIVYYKKRLTPLFIVASLPRIFNFAFVRGKFKRIKKQWELKSNSQIAEKLKQRDSRFDQFAGKYFKYSNPYVGYNELKESAYKYDAFLTGSDQVWLPANLGSHFFTQEFVPMGKRKIAYAPSFGVSRIPRFQKKRIRKYLERFNFLSVREVSGRIIIQDLIQKTVPVVADPTLLLTAEEWNSLIPRRTVIEGDYIFCYLLGTNPEHRDIAMKLKKQTDLMLVTIPFLDHFVKTDVSFGDVQLYDIDACDFVNLIRGAKYILTDSLHGTVFSILNQKQFITLNRFKESTPDSRNSRIDNLCMELGLEDRRYSGDISLIEEAIDYSLVNKKLCEFRQISMKYLSIALKA